VSSEETDREILTSLDNEWHTLKCWNPVPGWFPQTGAETVRVRGVSMEEHGGTTITRYEVVVLDEGRVVGRYRVEAQEELAGYEYRFDDEGE